MIDDTNDARDGRTAEGPGADDPIGPVTLPGRFRSGVRTMALAGFMLGVGLAAGGVAPPITTISSAIY